MPLVDLGPVPTKKKATGLIDLGPAPTPITEALTAVEEPTEERPRFEAAPEPGIGQRIKDYFREPQMPVAYDLPEGRKYRTLPPTREEQPLRSLAELGAYGLGQYGVGRALYTPELITERPVEKLVAPISAAEPTPKEKRIGESLKFIGGLRTAGQILGPVIATFPTASQQAIIGGAGVFGLRNITEQLVNWKKTGKTPSLEAFAKETALGALFGTAEVGLRSFVGFVKGLGNLKKGNVSWTNIKKPQDVADAIKHFQKTGDKSKWEAIRVKYAGITEKGASRIKARAEAIPSAEAKVKEFGKFPLARVGEAVRPPTKLAAAPPVAKVPPEGIKLPPKPTEAKKPYYNYEKAKRLTQLNPKLRTLAQLHKDKVLLLDYNRLLTGQVADSTKTQIEGGFLVPVIHPDASGMAPKDAWLVNNIATTLDETLAEIKVREAPKVAPVAEGKEKIISAAIKVNNQVFTGDTHSEAFDSARGKLKPDMERLDFIATADIQSSTGFMTDKGRYVESDEALVIAKKAKQDTEAIELSIAEQVTPTPSAAKEAWEMTLQEDLDFREIQLRPTKAGSPEAYYGNLSEKQSRREWERVMTAYHKENVQEAVEQGKPVPREVLEEYKGEKWAQEALAKPTKKIKIEQLYEEARKYPSAGNFSFIANREYGISSKQAMEIWEKAQPAKPKLVDLGEAPKVKPKKKPKITAAEARRRLKEHYAPGNIVFSGYWKTHDRVIDFKETDIGWEVIVQKVEKQDGKWVAVGDERTHMTAPSKGDKVVERVAPKPPKAPEVKAVKKVPGAEVEAKPGPAKTLETIRAEGEKKADITIFYPKKEIAKEDPDLDIMQKTFPGIKRTAYWDRKVKNIQKQLKKFANTVPEFKLNPTFTFEKKSGKLVFKDRYRFAFDPSHFGLDAEQLKDGQTIRFDLESFDIKKPTKAALRKAEPFLGEPKVLGRVTKKPTPSALWGEPKRKPRKPTKAEEEYYKALGDIETGVKKEVPGGITISRVTEKDVERAAKLGKKAGQKAWTVEREILARGEKGLEKEAVSIEKAIKIIRGVFAVPKGKPGFVDIRPILKAHKVFMGILEPSKAVERKQGKEAYAAVIKAIHTPEVGRLEFNQAELTGIDKTIQQLGEWFEQFPDKDLRNLMASRGDPVSVNAQLIKRDAMRKLPKELRTRKVFNAIQQIANFNYKYLQKVVGDDIKRVADYFYGIYKSSKKVDKFLDYWRTTKRFTKEKKLPTVADALDYGLELRNNNPVANLRAEYVAIAHLEGMNWLQEELMRTGKGKFIDNMFDAPVEWEKVYDPIFKDLRVEPDLAKLINNLIASNKITKVPILDTVRQVNNFLRTTKFIGSAFHLLSVAKQSVADSGYLGFLYKPTALRGFTTGFRKYDPIYKTTQYKDYIRHGGGHRYSIESEARRTFTKAVNELNKNFGKAVKAGALPLRVPVTFVNWMFNSYIPKVKYSKYLDNVAETEKKLKRSLKSSEKIDIIKEQQNFYGMMNERLFGRSGTVTTAMRFYFLAPGYAEGNYRTMIKGATQWSGKRGYKANRSRSNMVNSVILTGMLATVGTMIFTGKLPKKPETVDDIRDLFKIDTGRKDNKGRQIMIDLMTYDKDYWNVAFNVLRGRPEEAIRLSVRRIGGMKAPLADMIVDLALVSLGRTVYDWKGDRVTEITDPFLRKVMKYTVHEVKKIEPIPTSVYKTARRRGIDRTVAALETLGGWRPTYSEADRREKQLLSKMYSLRGQREQLSWYIGKSTDPEGLVRKYNKTVNDILDSPYLPAEMRKNWAPKLLIDPEKAVYWKRYPSKKLSVSELRKAINKSTYKKPHKRNGVTYPIGHPHKGKEEYVKSLRAELRKRREKGMLRQ